MAPTSTRSSSISSVSTSSSKSSSDGIKKKFGCSHPGCGKSFSRSEHLHRHALNHKDGNNTCLRCSAHFRRRDLLDRHMARHKEKDDEAGGEGLGILATRKRLWRDADGNIVNARRPSYVQDGTKRRALSRPERKSSSSSTSADSSSQIPMSRTGSTASSTIIVDTSSLSSVDSPGYASPLPPSKSLHLSKPDPSSLSRKDNNTNQDSQSWLTLAALPSPPISSSSASTSEHPDDASELDALYEDTWPLSHNGLPEIINDSPVLGRTSEYPASPSWGPQPFQTFMGAMAEPQGLFDDVFKSESGYEWLSGGQWSGSGMQAMSRCREEKYDPLLFTNEGERKREWSSAFSNESGLGFRRGFGLGTA